MNHALAVLVFLATVSASAATPLLTRGHVLLERSRDTRAVDVLLNARRVQCDPSGTCWVYHAIRDITREPSAAGVTALWQDGTVRTYLASDVLPPGSVQAGTVGQLYGIAALTGGLKAATAGWIDPSGETKNAIVFFRESADGSIETRSIIRASSPMAIAAGPRDTIVVAVADPTATGEFNLVTVMNADGVVLATALPFDAHDNREAALRLAEIQLQQVGASEVAVLDAATEHVRVVQIVVPSNCPVPSRKETRLSRLPVMAEVKSRFAAEEAWSIDYGKTDVGLAEDGARVIAFAASPDRALTLVRTGLAGDAPATIVTRHHGDGVSVWKSEHYWDAALVRQDSIHGYIANEGAWEESLDLVAE